MTVISGKDAYVNNVPCTTSWSASKVAAIRRYVASCTDGGSGVVEGNVNWQGSMSGLGPNPPVIPGTAFTFRGIIDNTGGDALELAGTILPENVQIRIPVAGGGPITWTCSFGVQGSLTSATTGASDSTAKLALSAKDTGVTIDPAGTPVVVGDIQNINLNFAAPSSQYVSSGVVNRLAGNIQAGLSFDVLARDLLVAAYQPNQREVVHVIMSDATYWLFDEIVFGGLSNFQVNVATRQVVGYTVSGMWSAVSQLAVDNLGQLKSPAGTDWFGSDP